MRTILLVILFLISVSARTQIRGNGNIKVQTFPLALTEIIKINLYAQIIIDCKLEETITITTDENIFNLIDIEVKNGILDLSQIEWIQSSKAIKITIGAPNLKLLESDTHGHVQVRNFYKDSLEIVAPIGSVHIVGEVNHLTINAKNGSIDASSLIADNALITLTGNSQTKVHVLNKLVNSINEDAYLNVVNTPKLFVGDLDNKPSRKKSTVVSNLKWISFKIKNNSWNRNKFVVVGPNKNGGQFSYGFAMMPGITKKERWSTGTKIYRERGLGQRQLMVTISDEDEGETIRLFSH